MNRPVAAIAVISLTVLLGQSPASGIPQEPLGTLDCDEIVVDVPADRVGTRGDLYREQRSTCRRGGTPVAFAFVFIVEPDVHPVGDVDDPNGGVLAISGDGWRVHLVDALADDMEAAAAVAKDTGGTVGRLIDRSVCLVRHPSA